MIKQIEISIDDLNDILKKQFNFQTITYNSAEPLFAKKVIIVRGWEKVKK